MNPAGSGWLAAALLGLAVAALLVDRRRALAGRRALLAERRRLQEGRAEADRMVRATAETMVSVIDAVTEQAVVGTDADGTIRVWNPGAEALSGLRRADVVRRRSVLEFLEDAGTLPDVAAAARRDWTWLRADGDRRTVSLAVTPRLDARGGPVGWTFVATDVTDARAAQRLKDEFVGVVSHELRTPISSVLGYLDLVLADPHQPVAAEHRELLQVAERNARRLLRLVGDLLLSAQEDAGSFGVLLEDCDLAEITRAARDTARVEADRAGVDLLLDLPDGPCPVAGDPLRLAQAADNLVGNAVKFTPRGGTVTLTVVPRWQTDDGILLSAPDDAASRVLCLQVRDTGIGIPPAEQDQLFTRFFRASTARRGRVPGIGLGLSTTGAIAAAHGGRVALDSTVGVGTTATLVLPAQSVAVPTPV